MNFRRHQPIGGTQVIKLLSIIALALMLSTATIAQSPSMRNDGGYQLVDPLNGLPFSPDHQLSSIDMFVAQSLVDKGGKYLIVESRDNNAAFSSVIAAFEKAGYRRSKDENIQPGTKTDTWCKIDVYHYRRLLAECHTPQMGHGISVRDELSWTTKDFVADYSGVVPMVAKIRDEHRRASVFLGIK